MEINGTIGPSGQLGIEVIRANGTREYPISPWPDGPLSLADCIAHGLPQSGLPAEINRWRRANFRHFWRGLWRYQTDLQLRRVLHAPVAYGRLWMSVHRHDGHVEHLGLAGLRVVTTAGVNFIVDAFQNTTEVENLKYHGCGTGTTAEASGDTALVTESTTALNPDSTRATGTTTEGASANIYRTVGTATFDGTAAITEHGIFSQAATGGGTLLDRTVFSAVNVVSGDSIQFTYDLTLTAGS